MAQIALFLVSVFSVPWTQFVSKPLATTQELCQPGLSMPHDRRTGRSRGARL